MSFVCVYIAGQVSGLIRWEIRSEICSETSIYKTATSRGHPGSLWSALLTVHDRYKFTFSSACGLMHCRGVTPELLLTFSAKTGLPESALRCMNSKCSVPYSARILLPPDAHGQFLPIPLQEEEMKRDQDYLSNWAIMGCVCINILCSETFNQSKLATFLEPNNLCISE